MDSFMNTLPAELSPDDLLRSRDLLLKQTAWARQYTRQIIDSIPAELWYVQAGGLQTHVAWQVGHLAVSQYGLMLFRQRGRMPGDLELMPGWLRKQFGRGTTPSESAEGMPTPADLLAMLEKINAQAHAEVALLTADQLAEPIEMPYAAYPIKLGALLFCPLHESIHAGQLGLLRRLHGLAPLR